MIAKCGVQKVTTTPYRVKGKTDCETQQKIYSIILSTIKHWTPYNTAAPMKFHYKSGNYWKIGILQFETWDHK
jgi:hypothetical protein